MLYGIPNLGKSFLTLDLCCRLATKSKFCEDGSSGLAVYLGYEGLTSFCARTSAWEQHHDKRVNNRILNIHSDHKLYEEGGVEHFIEGLRKFEADYGDGESVKLIVIDTLSRANGELDKNKSHQMMQFIKGCSKVAREMNAAVLMVHHPEKTSSGARGSTAIVGALDFIIGAKKGPLPSSIVMKVEKQRDGEAQLEFLAKFKKIRLESTGDESLTVSSLERIEPSKPEASKTSSIMEYIMQQVDGRSLLYIDDLRQKVLAKYAKVEGEAPSLGALRMRFARSLEGLQKDGLVCIEDQHVKAVNI